MRQPLTVTEQGRIRISPAASAAAPATTTQSRGLPPLAPPARVPKLDYRLAVLTNGRSCLRETLEAFRTYVDPPPADVLVFDDGGTSLPYGGGTEWAQIPYVEIKSAHALGFCAAVPELWRAASAAGPAYVFWIEDDQVLRRPLDLAPLALVLAREKHIAQMSLMRQAVNALEIAAGGCRALRPELYEERDEGLWLESRTNFSTGCSLIRRSFMTSEPWPAQYEENCEGRFSIDLLERGYRFGVWGDGSPWVEHVGIRSGFGY